MGVAADVKCGLCSQIQKTSTKIEQMKERPIVRASGATDTVNMCALCLKYRNKNGSWIGVRPDRVTGTVANDDWLKANKVTGYSKYKAKESESEETKSSSGKRRLITLEKHIDGYFK